MFLECKCTFQCASVCLCLFPHIYARKGSAGTYISHSSFLFIFFMQRITRWVRWPKYRHSSPPHTSLPGFRKGGRKTLRVKQNKVWDVNLFFLFGQENSYVKAIIPFMPIKGIQEPNLHTWGYTPAGTDTCVCMWVWERERARERTVSSFL